MVIQKEEGEEDHKYEFLEEEEEVNEKDAYLMERLEDEELRLKFWGIKFRLYDENKEPLSDFNIGNGGIIAIQGLKEGTYYIQEIRTNANYELDEEMVKIEVKPWTEDQDITFNVLHFFNKKKECTSCEDKYIDIDVEKVWEGNEEQFALVELEGNGQVVDVAYITKDNDWKHTFKNLDKLDEDGEEIKYTVNEVEMEGYEVSIEGDIEEGYIVTNKHVYESPKTEIKGTKYWIGGVINKPDIELQLYRNGDKYKEPVLIEGTTEDKYEYGERVKRDAKHTIKNLLQIIITEYEKYKKKELGDLKKSLKSIEQMRKEEEARLESKGEY